MINLDIVKALQSLPIWKRLVDLPDRVDALERRLAALEAAQNRTPSSGTCKKCHGPMRVIDERPDPIFGDVGDMRLTLECQNPACGHRVEKLSSD